RFERAKKDSRLGKSRQLSVFRHRCAAPGRDGRDGRGAGTGVWGRVSDPSSPAQFRLNLLARRPVGSQTRLGNTLPGGRAGPNSFSKLFSRGGERSKTKKARLAPCLHTEPESRVY